MIDLNSNTRQTTSTTKKKYKMDNVHPYEMSIGKSRLIYRYNSEKASFKAKVADLSGENIDLCFQCGACSSGCPLTEKMDMLPSKIVRYVQLGEEEVLNFETIWVCSTCFNCEVRCPRGIDVANIMEALRQLMLRKKYDRVSLDEIDPEELKELPQIAIISNLRKLTG